MKRMSLRAACGIGAAFLAAGCSYSFKNPAESLRAGEVQGRLVAERAGAAGVFDPESDVTVGLRNSALVAMSRPSGFFAYLDLPPGRHMLLFRKGRDMALSRAVEMELGSDGQPQGVMLGDVALRYMVNVTGAVTLLGGNTPYISDLVVLDDMTGMRQRGEPFSFDSYNFAALPVGAHVLRYAAPGSVYDPVTNTSTPVTFLGGPLPVTLLDTDQRTTKSLAPVALTIPAADARGTLTMRVRIVGNAQVTLDQLLVQLFPGFSTDAEPIPTDSLIPQSPSGLVSFNVLAGYYRVAVGATQQGPFQLPPSLGAVVFPDQESDLGDVYVVGLDALQASQSACRTDADCASGCENGACLDPPPPTEAPNPAIPYCDLTGMASCDPVGSAYCPGAWACVPIGQQPQQGTCIPWCEICTIDGTTVLDSRSAPENPPVCAPP